MAFVFEEKIGEENIFDKVKADARDKIDKGLLPFRCSLLYFAPGWQINRAWRLANALRYIAAFGVIAI